MNLIRGFCKQDIFKRSIVAFGAVLALVIAINYAPVLKVGTHSTAYTWGDVIRFYEASTVVDDIMGGRTLSGRGDTFHLLTVTAMKKEILTAKGIEINPDVAVLNVETRTPLKGMLKKVKSTLGSGYYRLHVEPLVVSEIFSVYYRANEPWRKTAIKVLESVKESGLEEGARKTGMKAEPMFIPDTPANSAFMTEIRAADMKNPLYGKLVEDAAAYLVLRVKEIKKEGVMVDAIVVRKQQVGDFIQAELKANRIPVSYAFYSPFGSGTVMERGIFWKDSEK